MCADVETRLNESDSDSLRLWLRLNSCNNQVQNYIREKMRQEFNLTLPRFDLMAQLIGHKNGLKMGEISERLMVSNGNTTSIVLQLEKDGLVERLINQEDRRSTLIRLTTKGTKLYNKINKSYVQWLEDIFAIVSTVQYKRLHKDLSDLKLNISKRVNKS